MQLISTGSPKNLAKHLLIILLLLPAAYASANQLDAPSPRVSGTVVYWDSIPGASRYNIHLADGSYVTSTGLLRFDALDFFSLDESGSLDVSFFIVSTNELSWEFWGKSTVVRVGFAFSCRGCISRSPSEIPTSAITFTGGSKLETYENECFYPSIQPNELVNIDSCVAVCSLGGSAVGGACFVDATETITPDRLKVRLGTSTKIGQSTFECYLPSTYSTSLAVVTTVVVKCLSSGN